LFSLGTMAVYAATRTNIAQAASPTLSYLTQHVREAMQQDDVMQKYLVRFKQKLKLPLARDEGRA
jgi:hypothetical protein